MIWLTLKKYKETIKSEIYRKDHWIRLALVINKLKCKFKRRLARYKPTF